MKLTQIRRKGRFTNGKKTVNIFTGYNRQRGTDHLYYLHRFKRVFISDKEFWTDKVWTPVPESV